MKTTTVVVDIETSHVDFETLSESQQEYLLRDAEKEKDEALKVEKIEQLKSFTSLYPFTAKVIVIGMYIIEAQKSVVYYESDDGNEVSETELGILYKAYSEKDMLINFWKGIAECDKMVTFNGRGFDVPFLMLRSAKLGVKPTKNFMGYRYDTKNHVDLLEMFSFYGAYKKFNLDFYCHGFGVESPKSKGVSGMEVQELYTAGKIKEIARYCAGDILATYRLYKIWEDYLSVF